MPKISNKHTDLFYTHVDETKMEILKNKEFQGSKKNRTLTKHIRELFDCSPRTATRYIAEARSSIRDATKIKSDKIFKKALRDEDFMITGALIRGDLKLAHEGMKERNKLQGLYVEKIEQSGSLTMKNIDMSQFTEYGLERLKRGDAPEEVMLDPKSLKRNDGDKNSNTGSSGS